MHYNVHGPASIDKYELLLVIGTHVSAGFKLTHTRIVLKHANTIIALIPAY